MKHKFALACFGVVLASVGTSTSAFASDPFGVITAPRSVQWIPDKASATEFVIHGTFELNLGGTPPSYSFSTPPSCGYLHFKCPAGSESLCRMQWGEIEGVIASGHCRGFGSLSKVPSVTVHTEGTALGTADTYDLGVGTMDVFGVGECGTQVAAKCDGTTGDAGPSDTGGADTSPKTDTGTAADTGTTTDTGTKADTGTTPTDTGTPTTDTGTPAADTGTASPGGSDGGGGCSYGSATGAVGFGVVSLMALGLLATRRRGFRRG